MSAKSGRLLKVAFSDVDLTPYDDFHPAHPDAWVLDRACEQLDEYFEGLRTRFDVPIALMGSPFQLKVWSVLLRLPFGKTISYRDLAKVVGQEGACRAVGAANAANPLPIFVPCHRVVASDGTISGYLGGPHAKRALLDHELAGASLYAQVLA